VQYRFASHHEGSSGGVLRLSPDGSDQQHHEHQDPGQGQEAPPLLAPKGVPSLTNQQAHTDGYEDWRNRDSWILWIHNEMQRFQYTPLDSHYKREPMMQHSVKYIRKRVKDM
jgi:hypothetical protein